MLATEEDNYSGEGEFEIPIMKNVKKPSYLDTKQKQGRNLSLDTKEDSKGKFNSTSKNALFSNKGMTIQEIDDEDKSDDD